MTLKTILEQEITPKSLRNHILRLAPRKGMQITYNQVSEILF